MSTVPHLRITVGFSIAAVFGYAVFSVWAVMYSGDAALRGDTIGTWKSFGVLAFGFWLGSSSAGKAKADTPSDVRVTNDKSDPLPVREEK